MTRRPRTPRADPTRGPGRTDQGGV
jgi:hypothetical protein